MEGVFEVEMDCDRICFFYLGGRGVKIVKVMMLSNLIEVKRV